MSERNPYIEFDGAREVLVLRSGRRLWLNGRIEPGDILEVQNTETGEYEFLTAGPEFANRREGVLYPPQETP